MKKPMLIASMALVMSQAIIACQFPDAGNDCNSIETATCKNACWGSFYLPSGPSQWCVSLPEWGFTDCTAYSVPSYVYKTSFTIVYDHEGNCTGCNMNAAHQYPPELAGTCEQDYVPEGAGYCGT